ncbi:MAG: DUF3618 domain-containing protein [Microbacteriaceae bacterium]|nr:MAG: DUF3618 domain-containing protein [Microbacteriaceae bacterium]
MTADRVTEVERARAELVAALNAIEDKVNVPRRAKRAIRVLREDHPLASAALAVVAIAAVGATTWLVVSRLRRR